MESAQIYRSVCSYKSIMRSAALPDSLMVTTGMFLHIASVAVFSVFLPPSKTMETADGPRESIQIKCQSATKNTNNKTICECSFDPIYGSGFSLKTFETSVKVPWKGDNNLGKMLMNLRESLKSEG